MDEIISSNNFNKFNENEKKIKEINNLFVGEKSFLKFINTAINKIHDDINSDNKMETFYKLIELNKILLNKFRNELDTIILNNKKVETFINIFKEYFFNTNISNENIKNDEINDLNKLEIDIKKEYANKSNNFNVNTKVSKLLKIILILDRIETLINIKEKENNNSNTQNPSNNSNTVNQSNTQNPSNNSNTINPSNTPNTSNNSNTINSLNTPNTSNNSNTVNQSNTQNPSNNSNTINSLSTPNTSNNSNTINSLNTPNTSNNSNTINSLNTPNTSNNSNTQIHLTI